MIGIKKATNFAIILCVIASCLGMATKRLIYIHNHYPTLQGLIDHEKNHK